MRLSEAMRLGAMLKPQGFRALIGLRGRTCALGAALDAIGCLDLGTIPPMWYWAVECIGFCPACRRPHRRDVVALIAHLNDRHHWTRERIAELIATIEPHEEAAPVGDVPQREPVNA
jgi:hypothetical protein